MLSDRQTLDPEAVATALEDAGWVHCSGYPLLDDRTGDALAEMLGGRTAEGAAEHGRRLRAAGSGARRRACERGWRGAPGPGDHERRRGRCDARPVAPARGTGSRGRAAGTGVGGRSSPSAPMGRQQWPAGCGSRPPPRQLPGPMLDATGSGDAFAAALLVSADRDEEGQLAAQRRCAAAAMEAGNRLGAQVSRVLGAQGRVGRRGRRHAMNLRFGDEVRETLAAGGAVVALESSLIAQGLPYPHNLETALASRSAVREAGAVPATTAVADGELVVGADAATHRAPGGPRAADRQGRCRATSARCSPRGTLAATTVSAAMRLAALAGIRVMATGGIGGVHRARRAPARHLVGHRRAGRYAGGGRLLRGESPSSTCRPPSSCWRRGACRWSASAQAPCPGLLCRRHLAAGSPIRVDSAGRGGGRDRSALQPARQRRHALRPAAARRAGAGRG